MEDPEDETLLGKIWLYITGIVVILIAVELAFAIITPALGFMAPYLLIWLVVLVGNQLLERFYYRHSSWQSYVDQFKEVDDGD
jgi:hypothetical protein